eukprot:m.189246 g.189246  ORF g.189246 m.189246 type:complete len:197 (+) comp39405_c0_seq42:138-728(+)
MMGGDPGFKPTIQEIMEKFPVFCCDDLWIFEEFKAMTDKKIEEKWASVISGQKVDDSNADSTALLAVTEIQKGTQKGKSRISPIIVTKSAEQKSEVESFFCKDVAGPGIIVVENEGDVVQAFIAAEGKCLFEVDLPKLENCLTRLMASYYVFNLSYPPQYQGFLTFMQDMVMELPETRKKRDMKYSTYIASLHAAQ